MDKLKRYIIFLIGLFINSLGVSLVTKANLGTSPISSIPYVLSLNLPPTLGQFTIIFSLFLILLQLFILRKNFKLEHILQIPISVLFGYFIDLTMILLKFVQPKSYIFCIITLLIGCLVLGFGVYFEILADVAMLPGESFVRAITATWNTDFGITKIIFDVSMTITATILSLCFVQRLDGVREGTVMAALLVGFIARLFGRLLSGIPSLLFGVPAQLAGAETSPANTYVIAIGRQFGCGGHDIGRLLAQKLGYPVYDGEIIEKAAGISNYTPRFVEEHEESMTNSLLYDMVNQMYSSEHPSPRDAVFESEERVIREFADKGNCIIIGRCADEILKDYPNCFKVWLHAPKDVRIQRIMETENLSRKDAALKITQEDKRRANNYRYYTNKIWGLSKNYHITLDTETGYDFIAETIFQYFNIWKKKRPNNEQMCEWGSD